MLPVKRSQEDEEELSRAWQRWSDAWDEREEGLQVERQRVFQAWWDQATDKEREAYLQRVDQDREHTARFWVGLVCALIAGVMIAHIFHPGWGWIAAGSLGAFIFGYFAALFLVTGIMLAYAIAVWGGLIWLGHKLFIHFFGG